MSVAMASAGAPLLLKMLSGAASLSMNVAMRHVLQDLSPMQQRLFQSSGFKCIAVFAMFYVSTRDVMLAVVLTAVTIVLLRHLLHEHSPLCIIPGFFGGVVPARQHQQERTSDALIMGPASGGPVTREVYNAALSIVTRFGPTTMGRATTDPYPTWT